MKHTKRFLRSKRYLGMFITIWTRTVAEDGTLGPMKMQSFTVAPAWREFHLRMSDAGMARRIKL